VKQTKQVTFEIVKIGEEVFLSSKMWNRIVRFLKDHGYILTFTVKRRTP